MQRDLEAITKIANYLDTGEDVSNDSRKLLKIASTALRETSQILEKTALENTLLKQRVADLENQKNIEHKKKRISGIIENMLNLSIIKRQDINDKIEELMQYDDKSLEALEKTLEVIPVNKESGLDDLSFICRNNTIKEKTKKTLEDSVNEFIQSR